MVHSIKNPPSKNILLETKSIVSNDSNYAPGHPNLPPTTPNFKHNSLHPALAKFTNKRYIRSILYFSHTRAKHVQNPRGGSGDCWLRFLKATHVHTVHTVVTQHNYLPHRTLSKAKKKERKTKSGVYIFPCTCTTHCTVHIFPNFGDCMEFFLFGFVLLVYLVG